MAGPRIIVARHAAGTDLSSAAVPPIADPFHQVTHTSRKGRPTTYFADRSMSISSADRGVLVK
jgi:hypothetical protein